MFDVLRFVRFEKELFSILQMDHIQISYMQIEKEKVLSDEIKEKIDSAIEECQHYLCVRINEWQKIFEKLKSE